MKAITIYECADGTRFDEKTDAEKYDCILDKVKNIMLPLGQEPDDYHSFQHEKTTVEKALAALMGLCAVTIPEFDAAFEDTTIEDCGSCLTRAGRVLSDYSYNFPCLYKAFCRFICINPTSFIEYDQPYWAKHEEEFKKNVEYYKKEGLL